MLAWVIVTIDTAHKELRVKITQLSHKQMAGVLNQYGEKQEPESVKLKIEKPQMFCGVTFCGFYSFHPMGELL